MRRIGTLMACGALALAFGCDERDPGIMLMDSGPDMEDAGPSTTPDSGPSTTPDAGDGCPPVMAPMPSMPMACEAATLTCLMSATTADAQQACIDGDANPMACNGCLNEDIIYTCTNGGGCEDAFGEVQCCLMEECPTGDETCINGALMGACGTDWNAFVMCINSAQMAMACGITQTCFQMSTGLLPDFDRPRFSELQTSYREWMARTLAREGYAR